MLLASHGEMVLSHGEMDSQPWGNDFWKTISPWLVKKLLQTCSRGNFMLILAPWRLRAHVQVNQMVENPDLTSDLTYNVQGSSWMGSWIIQDDSLELPKIMSTRYCPKKSLWICFYTKSTL